MFDNEILVKRAVKGDAQAFEELVLAYQSKIYSLALRTVGNEHDANDAAQEALIKIYRNLHTFKGNSKFSTWVYKLTLNACLDFIKKNKKNPSAAEFIPEQIQWDSPEDLFIKHELSANINALISSLGTQYSSVLILRDVEDFSYGDISEILDISIGTVKSRISRAREKMRILLLREQIIN